MKPSSDTGKDMGRNIENQFQEPPYVSYLSEQDLFKPLILTFKLFKPLNVFLALIMCHSDYVIT